MNILPGASQTFNTLKHVPLNVYMLLALAFMLINSSIIVPDAEIAKFELTLIVYMVFLALFQRYINAPGFKMNLNKASIWFVGGFAVTTLAMVGLQNLPFESASTYAVTAPFYLIISHVFIVAYSEEMIFRGALPNIITPIPAAVAFSLFHVSAYGGNILSLVVAFVAGMLFYVIMRYTNIWTVIGVHSAYNCAVLGVLGL